MMASAWQCSWAWLGDGPVRDVLVEVGGDGLIASVTPGVSSASDATVLGGVVLPGFANSHSHAFHRALRGRTHDSGGSFWTWRERMYGLAAVLDPDTMFRLARAVYAEMVLSGVSCVGEFHYLHHARDGLRYADPNAMGEALRAAARDAGLRLTLLDTCYLTGGIGQPLTGVQVRFGDGNAAGWSDRVRQLGEDDNTRIGAAVHSVRAVPPDQFSDIAAAMPDRPLHIHLSEQPAENEQCLAAYAMTPTGLLAEHNLLGSRTTAVHATHLTDDDVHRLGSTTTTACFCPTTERDLADGIGPARALADAGSPLSLGSDQHAVIDLMQEAQALEMGERVTTLQRGRFQPSELVDALTWQGHRSLGWPEAGRIAVGAPADLVAVSLSSVRTAGAFPGQVVLTASASDVTDVVVGGRPVVRSGVHVLGDVAALIEEAVAEVWASASA